MSPDFAAIVDDPAYLLDRVDIAQERVIFTPTSRDNLVRAAFLDGRIDFSTGSSLAFGLDDVLKARLPKRKLPDRFIFHISFCGSTLLSRMLDAPAGALVLKEPHCLVDLADWSAHLRREGRVDGRLPALLEFSRASLGRTWGDDDIVMVKPSNWANNLLAGLCADPASIRPVFIVMERRRFVQAVFRGGRERLVFTARVAAHLATMAVDGARLIQHAIASAADPLGQSANLAALAHHFQVRAFEDISAANGWDESHIIDFADIVDDPRAVIARVNRLLGLRLSDAHIAASPEQLATDAKRPEAAFSSRDRAAGNQSVEDYYGRQIDAAMHWAERTLDR